FIGGAPLFGDWQNPRTLGSIDLGPGNEGTDLKVRNGIVYMTGIASDAKKNDFFIIDATAPVTPVMRSQIDTGPGLNVVDVKGNYAYVGNRAATAHLQIIDVSNINGPFLAASIQLPGVSGSVFVKSVLIKDDTAYIGTDKNASGTEFFIYNVSDPLNPQQLGALEIGETVNAVAVQSGAAFLAMSGNPEVQSVDVSNPLNPFLIGTLDLAGTQGGLDLYLIRASTTAYLGRTVGTNKELVVLDLGDPSAMEVIGSIDITSDVNALVVKNPLAFLGTSEANSEFQVYYIDDPANITFWSSFNYPQAASGMDYENNTVYMSVRSNDALRIITSSP
ncbi:MAG: hypothetical protein HY435_00320, partial [Candidatus Liptonbacteria bacterium]|nr:hypothetical protein [Candidatus Liptonbacteria bacterium]